MALTILGGILFYFDVNLHKNYSGFETFENFFPIK